MSGIKPIHKRLPREENELRKLHVLQDHRKRIEKRNERLTDIVYGITVRIIVCIDCSTHRHHKYLLLYVTALKVGFSILDN
jgi:3-deoxy-D-arabino-heptulosonate 7-phosphate (DAHP) synthase